VHTVNANNQFRMVRVYATASSPLQPGAPLWLSVALQQRRRDRQHLLSRELRQSQRGTSLAVTWRIMRRLLPSLLGIAMMTPACMGPPVGYRTNDPSEAAAATAMTVILHPEMVQPRDAKRQKEMEAEANPKGKEIVPEGLLGPDIFVDSGAAPARYSGVREALPK